MHVLYIHQHFTTRAGSAGTRSYEFSRYLVRQGHKVSMLCGSYDRGGVGMRNPSRRWEHQVIDGIDVYIVNLRYSNYQGVAGRAWVFARFVLYATWLGWRLPVPDVVFATSTPLTVGLPGMLVSRLRRRPFVFEVRDIWPEAAVALGVLKAGSLPTWLLSRFADLCYRRAERVVVISPTMKAFLEENAAAAGKISVIPIGSDLDILYESKGVWRTRLNGADKCWIAYSGAHGLANELDRVLDAAALLRNRPDIEFLLVGDGRQKPRLMARAEREQLRNVRFLPPVSRQELGAILAEVDACILCLGVNRATAPALPNKFFEYLAAGKPILVNFPSDAASVVANARCGMSVAHSDPQALASAVACLAGDPGLVARMGQEARHLAASIFDRRSMAERFERLLLDAVNSHRRNGDPAAEGDLEARWTHLCYVDRRDGTSDPKKEPTESAGR